MQGAKTIALLALVVALSEARTSSPTTSTGGSAGGDNTPSPNPNPWNPWNPTPTTSTLSPWPQPTETTTSPPIPDPTTKTPKPPKTKTTEPPAPTETTEAPTSSPAPTTMTTTTAPPKVASNSGSTAGTVAVKQDNATTATPKPKATKTTISVAANEPSDESANLPADQPAATVAASQSTYGKNKNDDSTKSQDGNTKAAAGGGGSLSGLLTIIGVLVGAAVVGIMSIVIVKKHREEEGEDDDDEDWDMQHLEVKSTIPSTRANQHTYEADPMQYQQQRPTYRASEKMMMMADPRMSAPQNMQPVMVAPPQQQPMMQQQQQNYGMEFRDTESSQLAMLQQPQEFTDSVQEFSGMSECADAFLDEHVSEQYTAHQAAEQYLAKQQAAENFLEQNGDENDIEGDSERESEMPLGVVDIDEPTPSEAYGHRASEQSLGGMAGMTQQYNDQLYGQPSVDEGQLSIDEEGCSEVDLGASVASGLSSVGDNFMEQQVYNDAHPSDQYVNRASEEVQEGLEFQTDLNEPMAMEPTVEEEATGSTYCDRSSFGVFSVRDASFDSAAQDPRFSQESTFSVGTDVDIDDHDNTNGSRFTEMDEEFEV